MIKPIKYSEKFMEKFGTVVLQRKREWSFVETVWYMIDWRNRKLKNLQSWANANKNTLNNDEVIVKFINSLNVYGKKNHRKAISILRFVHKHLKYERDSKVWSCGEMWQTPLTTWTLKTGDCEDGAILINELMRMAGIPDYQREIRVGDVVGGGHAYFVYTSELDGLEYELDWCYWFDSAPLTSRQPLYLKTNYLKLWFGFNEVFSYKKIKNPNKVIYS
jgi:predicted transglutaminase-like cysteine proteinase